MKVDRHSCCGSGSGGGRGQGGRQRLAVGGAQSRRVGRVVHEEHEGDRGEADAHDAFNQEQPAPVLHAACAFEAGDDGACEEARDRAREAESREEEREAFALKREVSVRSHEPAMLEARCGGLM